MALDTKTIERLITDRTEALHLEAPDAVKPVSDTVRCLLVDLVVLNHLRRGGDQIPEYDATHQTKWNDEFVAASSDQLRLYLKNSPAARLQRVFTHPEQRVVPRIHQGNLDTLSLDGFIIHPDRIPGTLLVKTGLIHEEELHNLNGDEIGRLIVKHDLVASVRMMIEASTPIGPKQGRLRRINMPSAERREQSPDAIVPHATAIGAILYTRGKQQGAKESDDLQIHYFDSSYDALRKTFHAESGYDAEIDALAECQRDLDSIRSKLDRGYRRDASEEFKKLLWEQAETAINRSSTILRNAQATHKVQAREFIAKAGAQRTSTGKPNVSPAMSQITAALTRINNRFTEIRNKGGYNAEDRLILHENIRGDEWTLLSTRHELADCAADVASKNMTAHDARRMLELRVCDLERLRVRPLSVFADAMIRQIQLLEPDSKERFNEQLLRLHVIGKIQGIRTSAERIRGNAAKKGAVDYAAEAVTARQVERAIRTEQIFPGMTIAKIEDVMEPLVEQWSDLCVFLEDHARTPPEDADETQKALEVRLDDLGTENAAIALTSWLPEAISYVEPFVLTSNG